MQIAAGFFFADCWRPTLARNKVGKEKNKRSIIKYILEIRNNLGLNCDFYKKVVW